MSYSKRSFLNGNVSSPRKTSTSYEEPASSERIAAASLLHSLFSSREYTNTERKVVPITDKQHADESVKQKTKTNTLNKDIKKKMQTPLERTAEFRNHYSSNIVTLQSQKYQSSFQSEHQSIAPRQSKQGHGWGNSFYSANSKEIQNNNTSGASSIEPDNNTGQEPVTCTCKKSKCLKLYW